MDNVAIKVDHLNKDFKLPNEKAGTIKSAVVNFWRRDRGYEMQHALKDISLEVKQGEFFGIVGSNGSGKSTMLKVLAGIYAPTEGEVHVNGKLTPFIELGVGFNPELTGRENIYLNGALLGFNRQEMQAMYKDIVEFAELERFMDQKLKNYSSGMQVRLAFSIAIRVQSDILLIDEVLAVGDSSFQKKCFDYFYELKQKKQTVVFVSHDLEAVQRFCDRAAWIQFGELKTVDEAQLVVDKYKIDIFEKDSSKIQSNDKKPSSFIDELVVKLAGKARLKHTDKLKLSFEYKLLKKRDIELRLAIVKDGVGFAHISTKGYDLSDRPGNYKTSIEASLSYLMNGEYSIYCGIFDSKSGEELAYKANIASFYVTDKDEAKNGIVRLDSSWLNLPLKK